MYTNKKPGQWKAYLALTWYSFRAQTRNPATFFFGFIFPVVFISIFGLIGNSTPKIAVGVTSNSDMDNPVIQAVQKQPYFVIQKSSQEHLNTELAKGKIAGILDIRKSSDQAHYSVDAYLSTGFPQEAAAINAFIQSAVAKSNLQIAGVKDPAIRYQQKEVVGRKARYIDFALPGQIGFSLLSTAIFGTVFGLIYLKKALILKRMFATPTKAMTILLAQGTSRLIVALAQTVLILVLGVIVFRFYLPHGIITFFELLVLSAFGLIAFLGFGYLIAGLSSDENAASPLTNLVTLPQFLLSGTFFSTDLLPQWIQPIANNLPLSYFNIAVRKITTEGGTILETWPYLLGLAVWGAVMYILAARTFKWQ